MTVRSRTIVLLWLVVPASWLGLTSWQSGRQSALDVPADAMSADPLSSPTTVHAPIATAVLSSDADEAAAREGTLDHRDVGYFPNELNLYVPNVDLSDPRRALTDRIVRAENGDSVAMRDLARLAALCTSEDTGEPMDTAAFRAAIDRMYHEAELPPVLHPYFLGWADVCEGVLPKVLEQDWFALGREAGDPVLLLYAERQDLTRRHVPSVRDEAERPALLEAARTFDPNVLRAINLSRAIEIDSMQPEDTIIGFAWEALSCRWDITCDKRHFDAFTERELYFYQREEVLREVEALESLIERGELPGHDLRSLASAP